MSEENLDKFYHFRVKGLLRKISKISSTYKESDPFASEDKTVKYWIQSKHGVNIEGFTSDFLGREIATLSPETPNENLWLFDERALEPSYEERLTLVEKGVHDLNDWRMSVNKRIEEFDFEINAKLIGERFPKIKEYSKKLYGQIGYVDSLIFNPNDQGLKVTVIHSNDDRIEAINQCEKTFEQIEDAFPDLDIEFMVLHKSEIINSTALKGERIDFH